MWRQRMRNLDIEKHIDDMPGFKLVGFSEVGIPYYVCNLHFLYSQKRKLPIVQEYVLNLIKIGVPEKSIYQLLAIDNEVVSNALIGLYQIEYINLKNITITPQGNEYLEYNKIDTFEKGEIFVAINAITGDILDNVKQFMSIKSVKTLNLFCLRSLIDPNNIDVNFKKAKKVFLKFKEQNEMHSAGELIEIIHLEKQNTQFQRINILIFQNDKEDVRILAYQKNKLVSKYEPFLKKMDKDYNVSLLPEYKSRYKTDTEFSFIKIEEKDLCDYSEYEKLFNSSQKLLIVIPLFDFYDLNENEINLIKYKIGEKHDITIVFSGLYCNQYQNNVILELNELKKKNRNLSIFNIPFHAPYIIASEKYGIISQLSYNKINLKITKSGITERLYKIEKDEIVKIYNCIEDLNPVNKMNIKYLGAYKKELVEKMLLIQELIIDSDSIIVNKLGSGILHNGLIDKSIFSNPVLATNKDRFSLFITNMNKLLYESISTSGVKDFYRNDFKSSFPQLYRIIDKVRVYRNSCNHGELKNNNIEKYVEYLNEDLSGMIPDIIDGGFLVLQNILITSLEENLRKIVCRDIR